MHSTLVRKYKRIREQMAVDGIAEQSPFTPGISVRDYGPNIELWVLVNSNPGRYAALSRMEKKLHRSMSRYGYTQPKNFPKALTLGARSIIRSESDIREWVRNNTRCNNS